MVIIEVYYPTYVDMMYTDHLLFLNGFLVPVCCGPKPQYFRIFN